MATGSSCCPLWLQDWDLWLPVGIRASHLWGSWAAGELTDQDKLVYVNNVIKGKLLESEKLKQQAANNTKEQFANSPDLKTELMNAIIEALEAHTAMSTQALGSEAVRAGLRDVLMGPARLYESLRQATVAE